MFYYLFKRTPNHTDLKLWEFKPDINVVETSLDKIESNKCETVGTSEQNKTQKNEEVSLEKVESIKTENLQSNIPHCDEKKNVARGNDVTNNTRGNDVNSNTCGNDLTSNTRRNDVDCKTQEEIKIETTSKCGLNEGNVSGENNVKPSDKLSSKNGDLSTKNNVQNNAMDVDCKQILQDSPVKEEAAHLGGRSVEVQSKKEDNLTKENEERKSERSASPEEAMGNLLVNIEESQSFLDGQLKELEKQIEGT